MIRFLGPADLAAYRAAGDPVLALLGDPRARGCAAERWLAESEPKRVVAWSVYGPLLAERGLRILDVGGGFSSLSYLLAERHDYRIVDFDAAPEGLHALQRDWAECSPDGYDVVVSVDLFPNVDQRLGAFLGRYGEVPLRLVLTTYRDRWYRARRDEGEVLTVQAWDWPRTRDVLGVSLDAPDGSLFPNGRQVCLLAA